MLKSSRTWPSILTMAVVQLKFDQRGKYSYSAITDINESHRQHLLESATISPPNGHSDDIKRDSNAPHNGGHKKDLITRKNVKGPTSSCRPHNGNCTSPGKNGKVCLCELEFGDKRKRSESIKVENWDYIYKEKCFGANLEPPDDERAHAPPKWVPTQQSPSRSMHGWLA